MHSSIKKGKGMKLALSPKEIKLSELEGMGLWSDFKDMTKKAVKELAPIVKKKVTDYAKKHGKDIARKSVKILAEKASKKDERVGELVEKLGDKGIDFVEKKTRGRGRPKKTKVEDEDQGEGWKEFWRGTKKLA